MSQSPSHRFLRALAKASGRLWHSKVPLPAGQLGLDIGCGPHKRSGFLGADLFPSPGVDVVCDLDGSRLPFADQTFDVIYASHVLEHVHHLDELLDEIARVLKSGGHLQVRLPYAGSLSAFQDPTHVRFFTLKTFEYFVAEGAQVGGWYTSKPFRRITQRHLSFSFGPLSMLMALVVNRSQWLLLVYEASPLRVVAAWALEVELEKE